MKIQLGYSCISTLHPKLKCGRASTKTYLEKMSPETCHDYLLAKARENLKDFRALLYENQKNQINAFRVPEQFMPQVDLGYYQLEELQSDLEKTGKIVNEYDMQISTHPSQYFVLNSRREDVVEKTIQSLSLFAETFERMQLKKTPNITIHVGVKNGYDSVEEAIQSFCIQFQRLSQAAQNYLVVENDHVSFTVEDCLAIHEKIGIPVVFDNMHYRWNPGNLPFEEAVKKAVDTWGKRIPKLHLSSDRDTKKHAHSEYIDLLDYLKLEQAVKQSGIECCYFILECKQKDKAVLELRKEIEKSQG